ncbi:ABC transporter permease [Streptomyces sp. NPDC003077]|uniref:ABC transporter permease n=1 Tax=Streptomyces sp. NPDC003077 TaxID=3154443 RepID=UPI0033B2F7BB
MTAPQTPHSQPPEPPSNPWSRPLDPEAAEAERRATEQWRAGLWREAREAAVLAVVVAVSGALLGLLWLWLAPRVPLFSDGRNVYLKNTEGEEAIGADGTFVLLALAFGVVTAAVVFLWRRRGGVPLVLALVVGGLLASLVAWQLGTWLGDAEIAREAVKAGKGVTFDAPLRLQAKGTLLAWPVAAMLVQLVLTGLFGPRDPEPEHAGWPTPAQPADAPHEE